MMDVQNLGENDLPYKFIKDMDWEGCQTMHQVIDLYCRFDIRKSNRTIVEYSNKKNAWRIKEDLTGIRESLNRILAVYNFAVSLGYKNERTLYEIISFLERTKIDNVDNDEFNIIGYVVDKIPDKIESRMMLVLWEELKILSRLGGYLIQAIEEEQENDEKTKKNEKSS